MNQIASEDGSPPNVTALLRIEEHLGLTTEAAIEIMRTAGIDTDQVSVARLQRWNHVWRIDTPERFYLKTHTKDWYSQDPKFQVTVAVDHEADAYSILAKRGLPTPTVVLSDESWTNPLGRPFILLRELEGTSFTELGSQGELNEATRLVGGYLAAMAIEFPFPSYLGKVLRANPPDPHGWQHRIWGFKPFQDGIEETWAKDEQEIPRSLVQAMRSHFEQYRDEMEASFSPPRFVHGDCHASQFFVTRRDGRLLVTGVLDMEVSSAGNPLFDFVKVGIEMAGRYAASTPWWVPLFEGYGSEPSLPLLKLALLASEHIIFTCYGEHSWRGTRAETVERLLAADTWRDLFGAARTRKGADREVSALSCSLRGLTWVADLPKWIVRSGNRGSKAVQSGQLGCRSQPSTVA